MRVPAKRHPLGEIDADLDHLTSGDSEIVPHESLRVIPGSCAFVNTNAVRPLPAISVATTIIRGVFMRAPLILKFASSNQSPA